MVLGSSLSWLEAPRRRIVSVRLEQDDDDELDELQETAASRIVGSHWKALWLAANSNSAVLQVGKEVSTGCEQLLLDAIILF